MPDNKLGSVYAFRTELDAWSQSRNLRLARDEVGGEPPVESLAHAKFQQVTDFEGRQQAAAISESLTGRRPATASRRDNRKTELNSLALAVF